MNKLISNPDKSVGMSDLSELYLVFKHYAVFKGNRHQVGRLLVEAVNYHYKRQAKILENGLLRSTGAELFITANELCR